MCEQVDLMQHFKMSTSRDFRINATSLQAAMEQAAAAEDASGDSDASANSDEQVSSVGDGWTNVKSYPAFIP